MLSQFFIFSLLVPTIFAMWHLEWEKACPRDFPLPPSMLYFGPVKIRTHFRFIFDSEGRESRLSQVVTRAWETVSESGRQLMLFCWSGLNTIRHPQNCSTHPDVNKSSARAILRQDFHGAFEYLYADACDLAGFLFGDEGGSRFDLDLRSSTSS
jgi:hypothetical protein